MVTWQQFEAAVPELAGRVRSSFEAHKHHTMATLRRDGSPRISGTEVEFADGELRVGIMAGARRVDDLRRDPRLALHSQGIDPPEADQAAWPGEAKLSGRAVEDEAAEVTDGSHRFRLDIVEAVATRLGDPPDHLVIEAWHPDRGLVRTERR